MVWMERNCRVFTDKRRVSDGNDSVHFENTCYLADVEKIRTELAFNVGFFLCVFVLFKQRVFLRVIPRSHTDGVMMVIVPFPPPPQQKQKKEEEKS